MPTASIEGTAPGSHGKAHGDQGIVFGSTSTPSAPSKRPTVRATCEAIGLARSTYYYQSQRSKSATELEQKIVLRLHSLRESYPEDGYRRMTRQLQLEGFQVNRKRIARLMRLHGLIAAVPNRAERAVHYSRPPVANLRDASRLTGPHQAWLANIAYVHIRDGLVYVAAILDIWSREVVGYALSQQINKRLVSMALHSAVRAHRPATGCIHHSTCGSQYLMRGYRELLRQYGLVSYPGEAPATRRIIEMPEYETWENVIGRAPEFIQAVYSRDRIVAVLQGLTPAE